MKYDSHYPSAVDLTSPSGKMSGRARRAATERFRVELFGPNGLDSPQGPTVPKSASLRRQAAELLDLAARGMKPRAYTKAAAELNRQADELERDSL